MEQFEWSDGHAGDPKAKRADKISIEYECGCSFFQQCWNERGWTLCDNHAKEIRGVE